jgi:hypothetical protein
MFENGELRKVVFSPKGVEVTADRREFHDRELHKLHCPVTNMKGTDVGKIRSDWVHQAEEGFCDRGIFWVPYRVETLRISTVEGICSAELDQSIGCVEVRFEYQGADVTSMWAAQGLSPLSLAAFSPLILVTSDTEAVSLRPRNNTIHLNRIPYVY